MSITRTVRLIGLARATSVLALAVCAESALAQAPADSALESDASSKDIVVTGSRFGGRIATDSPTPIDSIGVEQLERGGTDLQSMLKVAVPSFSTPRPAAAGISDFLASPTMRGLSTGQMLLLINGKRRHTNSDLNTNNQIGRGDVAYEFSAIPPAAISRVEVLRDGAAAQYGSDAIGGVMNVVLDDSVGYMAQAKVGRTTHSDGEHYEAAVGAGFAIGGGSLRLTAQYIDHRHTDRALADTRQQYFGSGGLTLPSGNFGSGVGLTPSAGTLDPREAVFNRNIWVFGEPDYKNKILFANLKLPLGDVEFYAFGGWNFLDGTSYNFFRRAGQDETVRSIFPDGFLPINHVRLWNASAAAGIRGDDFGGFAWDLSTVFGSNLSKQTNVNANNVSLGAASPTRFFRLGTRFQQWTTNLDVSRKIPMGDGSPLMVAFGVEYRKEFYDLLPGEPLSYANGGIPIIGGPNNGRPAPIGSQPAAGLPASSAISGSRNSKAVYFEVEKTFFDRLLVDAAVRHEEFSDFGSTTDFKVASRLEIIDGIALRGSYGTGFRAPALAQIFFNSQSTSFQSGAPVLVKIVSPADPMAPLIGAPPLEPERSKNLSVGGVLSLSGFSMSVDWYRIQLKDRLTLSSNFGNAALTTFLAANGFPGIATVAFVTNGVDTTTKGIDVTATYRHRFSQDNILTATLAANFNDGRVDSFDGTPAALAARGITTPLVDLTSRVRLIDSTPKDKISLNLNYREKRFGTNLTLTRYGKVSQVALTARTPAQVTALLLPGYDVTLVDIPGSANKDIIQHFSADIVADLEFDYEVNDKVTFAIGANNILDKFPDRQIASTVATVATGTNGADNNGIFPYAYIAPYGTAGRFVYFRVKFGL